MSAAIATLPALAPWQRRALAQAAAIRFLVDRGADDITCICLLAAPEGVENLRAGLAGVDVPVNIVTAAMDSHLNELGYIVPGLGDAGDRLYGVAH